jgi:hypothetical protein
MSQTCGCGCRPGGTPAGVTTVPLAAPGPALTPGDTVEAAMRRLPGGRAVFQRLGIDTCCGGTLTLGQAAASAGVPVESVLAALAGAAPARGA